MMIFAKLELLPVAYFLIVMWVVCATVLGKIFGGMLVEATSGSLRNLLSRRVNVAVTGDEIAYHLFEKRLISNLNTQMLFTLLGDFARRIVGGSLVPVPAEDLNFHKNMYPEKHWSGCPPNLA
jgi:hypothetical protein